VEKRGIQGRILEMWGDLSETHSVSVPEGGEVEKIPQRASEKKVFNEREDL